MYGTQVSVNSVEPATGDTPLILASREGDSNLVSLLIENGANINYVNMNGDTALMQAMNKGRSTDANTVAKLLDYNADVSMENNEGVTALMLSAITGTRLFMVLFEPLKLNTI